MSKTISSTNIQTSPIVPLKNRLSLWRKVRGIWENRKTDPLKELKKVRKGWQKSKIV